MKMKLKIGELEVESDIAVQGYNECNIQDNIVGQLRTIGDQIVKAIEADKKPTEILSDAPSETKLIPLWEADAVNLLEDIFQMNKIGEPLDQKGFVSAVKRLMEAANVGFFKITS